MTRIRGVYGKIDPSGETELYFNPINSGKLLSPDGLLHAMPCETCRDTWWVDLKVVSFICDRCADPDHSPARHSANCTLRRLIEPGNCDTLPDSHPWKHVCDCGAYD